MGSNQNRHGDKKAAKEWGSRPRKEEAHQKQAQFDRDAIDDELNPRPTPALSKGKPKKNKKKWCKGKVGILHEWALDSLQYSFFAFERWRCSNCGRVDYHKEKPE